MEKEQLKNYPACGDYEIDLNVLGIGTAGIVELYTDSGTLVYLDQRRKGEDVAVTPFGIERALERDVVICGYLENPKGILKFLKGLKIRVIPEGKREEVKSKVIESLGQDVKISRVHFWESDE